MSLFTVKNIYSMKYDKMIMFCITSVYLYISIDDTIPGSQASRKVLEDWAAIDSDVDEVAESLSSKTSSHISKSWTVTSVITSFFMVIWTFITVSYTGTVDAVYRLVGHPRDTDIYTTPRRKLIVLCIILANRHSVVTN